MNYEIKKWNKTKMGHINYDAIRLIYPNKNKYRINYNKFAPGDNTSGIGRAGICYVIKGKCQFIFNDNAQITVEEGDIFTFSEGKYEVQAHGGIGVEYTFIWDIEKLIEILKNT